MNDFELENWMPQEPSLGHKYVRSDAHKANLSIAQKHYLSEHPHQCSGRQHTEETKIKMRGNHVMSPEGRAKLSEIAKARRGKNNTMYRKRHSEETKVKLQEKAIMRWGTPEFREKMRIAELERPAKISKIQKLNWQNPEYRAKVVPACLRSRRPTDLEAKLIALITKYSLPYKYTGDGSFIIGNLNPDFVNINGDKIAIEVFGGHWHQNRKEPLRTEEGRREILKEYGWKLVVIWGNEIKTMPEEAILEKIRREGKCCQMIF